MAAVQAKASVISPKNSESDGVFSNSDCKCCSSMKSDVQTIANEVKSMIETINILRDEVK
jgi:hypothetical protein